MHERRLNATIMYNGGVPITPLEKIILPIAQKDLDPLVKSLQMPVSQAAVVDILSISGLPPGWSFQSKKKGTPHLHLHIT